MTTATETAIMREAQDLISLFASEGNTKTMLVIQGLINKGADKFANWCSAFYIMQTGAKRSRMLNVKRLANY